MAVIVDPTARYNAVESYLYDRAIAPAVIELADTVEERLLAELPRGARVLEVGCGGGQLAVRLAGKRADLTITGLDLSPEQVARAKERARAVAERVTFVEGSALSLPFDDEHFDAVISVASVKHWPDPLRGLSECVRVLRPSGALAVVEADRGCTMHDARAFVSRWRIPRLLRPVALVGFRTFVAGNAFDLDDMRAFAAMLGPGQWAVERVGGTPALLLSGRRGAR